MWLNEFTVDDLWDLLLRKEYAVGQLTGDVPLLRAALDQVLPVLAERVIGRVPGITLVYLGF